MTLELNTPSPAAQARRLISTDSVVDLTGLSISTLQRLRKRGEFPRGYRISTNRLAFKEADVIAWIDTRQRTQ